MSRKIEIRGIFRKIRNEFYKNTISQMSSHENEAFYNGFFIKILEILQKHEKIHKISGFYPIKNEPDCLFLLKKLSNLGYETYLPFVEKADSLMIFRDFSEKNQDFVKDFFGTPSPNEKSKSIFCPDLVLLPLLAFDKNLNRLGYGKGFYDRCLAGCSKDKKYF